MRGQFRWLDIDFDRLAQQSPAEISSTDVQISRDVARNASLKRFLGRIFERTFNNDWLKAASTGSSPRLSCPLTGADMEVRQSFVQDAWLYVVVAGPPSCWLIVQNFSGAIAAIHLDSQKVFVRPGASYSEANAGRIVNTLKNSLRTVHDTHNASLVSALCFSVRPSHFFYDAIPSIYSLLSDWPVEAPLEVTSVSGMDYFDLSAISSAVVYDPNVVDAVSLNKRIHARGGFLLAVGDYRANSELRVQYNDIALVNGASNLVRSEDPSGDFDAFQRRNRLKLWLGLCSEKRSWPEQLPSLSLVIDEIKRDHKLAIVADGLTRPWSQSRHSFREQFCGKDIAALERLKQSHPSVEFVDMIGANAAEKIAYATACDIYISSAVTDSIWPARFAALPGVAHANTVVRMPHYVHPRTRRVPDSVIRDIHTKKNERADRVGYSIDPQAFRTFFSRTILERLHEISAVADAQPLSPAAGVDVRIGAGRVAVSTDNLGDSEAWVVALRTRAIGGQDKKIWIEINEAGEWDLEFRHEVLDVTTLELGLCWADDAGVLSTEWIAATKSTRVRSPRSASRVAFQLRGRGRGRVLLYEVSLLRL